MSGECQKCHEHCLDCRCVIHIKGGEVIKPSPPPLPIPIFNIEKSIIQRLEDIGICHEKISRLCDHEIFYNLSKHNPYWDSKDENASEKLHHIRCQLSYIQEKLLEVWSVLGNRGEE